MFSRDLKIMKHYSNIQKLVSVWLVCNFMLYNTSLTALAASEITVQGGNFATETDIQHNANVFNIQTDTTVSNGTTGINSFSKFNVGQGDIVNLNLIDKQSKLVNLIFDNSASQINGIVNSYMGGNIGGNILFANSHGFVVGQNGVFNVGSLTLMTPSEKSMEDLINSKILGGGFNEEKIERLIGFSFDGQNYLVTGNKYEPIELAPGKIEIDGKINAGKGIDLISGSEVNLLKNSELNANMAFSTIDGNVTATPKNISAKLNPSDGTFPQKFAMQDGNDIVIVSSNIGTSKDILSAIVNLNGKINANGGDVVAKTEVFKTNSAGNSKSQILVKDGANISGNNILMQAASKITDADKNLIDLPQSSIDDYYGYAGELVNAFAGDFVHIANVDTKVIVEKNATMTAVNNVILNALSDLDISASTYSAVLGFNYTSINAITEAIIKKGAIITARNLDINATTDLELSTSTKSSTKLDEKIHNKYGNLAGNLTLEKLTNRAQIEDGVTLNVSDNLSVIAKTVSNQVDTTKNGLIPGLDKNRGVVGAAVSVILAKVINEAILNSDVELKNNGVVNVAADYTGKISSAVTAYSGGEGESSGKDSAITFAKALYNGSGNNDFTAMTDSAFNDIKARGNADFSKLDLAGSVGVAIDNVVSRAKIGDSENNIKPDIKAGAVNVSSTLVDDKSNMSVISETENGKTTVSGAFALNYKTLSSDATAFADITVRNSNLESVGKLNNAVNISSKTEVLHPLSYYDWWPDFKQTFQKFFSSEHWNFAGDEIKDKWDNIETNNVSDYLKKLTSVSELSHLMDDLNFDMAILGLANTNNFGLASLFNTYAQSLSQAKTTTGETHAVAGAIAVGVFDTFSNAMLMDNSTITIDKTTGNSNINVDAYSNNEIWTMGSLLKPTEITSFMAGTGARDGSAYGAGVGFSFSDSDTLAKIGENVSIVNNAQNKENDLTVNAKSDGNYVNVTAASSSADDAGMSGSVSASVVTGDTIAAIEKSQNDSQINVKNATVNANKDANYVNGVITFANSQEATGWGVASTTLADNVKAYIAGNINAANDVNVHANYDKLIVNVSTNLGIAKKGTDAPIGDITDPASSWLEGTFLDDVVRGMSAPDEYSEYDQYKKEHFSKIKTIKSKMKKVEEALNSNYDFARNANPDKQTSAKAGAINATVTTNKVEAYIADGAKVKAGNNVEVSANQSDKVIDAGVVGAANGKSGVGATVMADVIANDTLSYIGAAEVDANKNISVNANQNTYVVATSAGVAQAKDKSGVGNLSSVVQVNDIKAEIKNGAKINQNITSNTQSVDVKANVDSFTAKGVGALSIQAGGNADGAKSVGATLDGDVVVNSITASIDGAIVNASNYLNVEAINNDRFIGIDMAGSASTQGSAYGGVVAAYVAANQIDAFINNSTIDAAGAKLNIKADSDFREIVAAGTVSGGDKTGVGATVRTDVVINDMNSYVKNSTVTANDVKLTNNEQLHQISVAVAGAGSSSESAGAGVANVFADITTQNNYVENSTLTVNSLNFDSDKSLFDVAVTGAIAASVGSSGTSVGASLYGVGVSHDINTYIKNSNIISTSDITLTSDFNQDMYNIIFGGAGGRGVTATGALSALVNDSNMHTFVIADDTSDKKTFKSTDGKITINSTSDVETLTVDGNVGISTSSAAAGAAVNTTVNNSNVKAGIDGANVNAKNGVDILAKADTKQTSTAIGASVGSTAGVEGSVDTVVTNSNVNAYIKNSAVDTETGNINVKSDDKLKLVSGIGAVAGATSGAAVGGSVQTLVVNKNITSEVVNSTLETHNGDIETSSKADTDILATVMGFGGASTAAINGTVATQVLNTDTKSEINNSTLSASKNISNTSDNKVDVDTYITSANGAGTAAVGGVVYSIVDNSTSNAIIDNSSNINKAETLKNTAVMNSDYIATTLNASGAGTAAVNGTVTTFVLNSEANAVVDGSAISNTGNIDISSNNTSDATVIMLQASGSGAATVNGGVNTFVSSKKSKAEVKNSTVTSTGNVKILADADNKIDSTVVGGAGSGSAAITGSVNTIVSSDKVSANVVNSSVTTSVANKSTEDTGILVKSDDTLTLTGHTGSASGSGGAAVGGAIVTGVVTNIVGSYVENSDLTSTNADIIITSIANETIGNEKNPFITIAAAGSGGAGVSGAVDTLILNSSSIAKVAGKKAEGILAGDKIRLKGEGNTKLLLSVGVGAGGTAGVGGTVSTVVIDKDIQAVADNTLLKSQTIDIDTSSVDDITNIIVAGSIGAATGVTGAVNTTVISSNLKSGINNSTVNANNIDVNSNSDAVYTNTTGAVSGGGVAGVGASVVTNVVGYNSEAYINNSTVKALDGESRSNNINVSANSDTDYQLYAISGAIGGTAGVGGVIETNIVNNTVKAYTTGDIYSNKLLTTAADTVNFNGIAGTLAGGEIAGVGATIQTNSVTSTILSYIGGTNVNAKDIDVSSVGTQNFNDLAVIGFGGGSVAVNGSSLANITDVTSKAYIKENATVTSETDLDITAKNTTTITESIGSGAVGKYAGVAASVGVNKITNTTEAFTEDGVTLNANSADFTANSITNLGKEGDELALGAGSFAPGVAVAGAVLVNTVENKTGAYTGKNNKITANKSLNLKAQDDTSIYESIGGLGVGLGGVGASVGVNTISSTVISSIGAGSVLDMQSGNVSLSAVSNEKVTANGAVVSGGGIALNGGILHNTIGKSVGNAQTNDLTGDDAESYNSAKKQAESVLSASEKYKKESNDTFIKYYNNASSDVSNAIGDANRNINSNLNETDTKVEISADNVVQKPSTFSLFEKSANSGSSYNSTDRNNTTSAFIDTDSRIKANDVAISAKDTNNVTLNVDGHAYGAGAVGVSAAVSNVNTTVNSFISNNVVVETQGKLDINADSIDNQKLDVSAGSGGIISGSGAVAKANSNKTTNAYILKSSVINTNKNITVNANSKGDVSSVITSGSYGGVSVGVSVADAVIKGNTKVDIGENVTLNSNDGSIVIKAKEDEKAAANASATAGSLVGGSGAEATAQAGKTNTINIGKNVNIISDKETEIISDAKNNAVAETNGRSYGAVSAGGTKTNAKIEHNGGVNIADADVNSSKKISAKSIKISSIAENTTNAQTKAGAGAAVGVSGSGVYTNINSTNNVYVGKNYTVNTTDGSYIVAANNTNKYKSYNDSSAYGAVGVTAGIIENNVTSNVKAVSNANIEANGGVEIFANNEVKKDAVSNYDLYGGAGGVVGVGAANLKDNLNMTTIAEFGGDRAHSTGKFNNGYINVSSKSIIDVNEKVDVTAGGAVPVADGNVQVKSDVTTKTVISNKDIKTLDDDIYFLANSDIDIYTKSNVSSYGGIAVADGESIAKNNNAISSVIINSGVKSISGRDTYIQSVCNKNIQAYMYAATKGLIGAVGGSDATAYNNSKSEVIINNGANIKSYDSMNVTALDTTSHVIAKREAKGTTYILFGIPITIYGSGHENTTNNSNATITLNGSLESGLGANKSLVVNKDGTYTSNGINVIGKEKVGEITEADIDSDIDAYETSKDSELKLVDDYVALEETVITDAQAKIVELEQGRANLQAQNATYQTAIDNATTIMGNNNKISNIDSVTTAWNSAYDGTNSTLQSSFGTALANYPSDENLAAVRSAYSTYIASQTADNLSALRTAVDNLATTKTTIQAASDALKGSITSINSGVDCSDNIKLSSFITTTSNTIATNNTSIINYTTSIAANNMRIENANSEIQKANNNRQNINAKYDVIISDLQKQKEEASKSAIPVYSLKVDDIYVRSGETNITGQMNGNGTITAPGNTFSIDIVNNSVSDIVYKDIQIDRNAVGGINGGNIAGSITKNIKNNNKNYTISILNTVDANDPTINLDTKNGFGDMVFMGDIENVNGLVKFVNYTGNILSEGSITAKDLQISVPNGGYTKRYDSSTIKGGGDSANGAIIASGDIDIASKVIDINGLIQSGSEIKSVEIPDFTVVKDGDSYYQVINGKRTKMEPGSSDGYYYINLSGNGQLDSDLELIKAYFKPSDSSDISSVKGEIYLFKAEIQGGNVTLTGNVISTSNNGKIVLVNGYGHIDVKNNSNYNLVTSALNADAKVQGKLTINDFKFSDTDKAGTSFDNLTQNTVEDSNWLSKNAGTYTANINEEGKITTTSSGQTAGNGAWGAQSSSKRADGANINTIVYTPGDDAYIVTKAGSVETKSYREYVKRSWWTEFWHGKLYRTVYYNVVHDPEYGVAKNNIQVQFQGFDTPQINVTSNGSIIINSSISALTGDVNLTSNNGSIMTNSTNNVISAQNIGLNANNGDIGSSLRPIQSAIYNNGTLSAIGDNIYINYPYSDISNINLTAKNNAYLATSGSKLGGVDSIVNINADMLELHAENGTIELDSSKNNKIDVSVNKIKARANGDISLTNKNDLNISSIVSTSKGTITLGSQNGSIIAADTENLNPYHINGGNIVLNAVNGSIGSSSNALKIARDGIYKVNAKGDINLNSAGRIYADLIKSESGKVNLDADYGIIASNSSDDLVYNIYSATGVDLNSQHGNIENIAINTDGVVNASAGYSDGIASGMSDISISLISKKELSQEYLNSLKSDEERQAALENYTTGLKDMQVGTVQASKNVFIYSEKSILNGNSNSSIKGEQILLSSGHGDIGDVNSAVKLDASREITAYAGNCRNVYLTSEKDLNVNEIRSFKTYNTETGRSTTVGHLGNVVLSSNGNIVNAATEEDKANVSADNISLKTNNDVGSLIKYFNVDTQSSEKSEGLGFNAETAYIKGVTEDLNIVSSNVTNDSFITAEDDLSITVQNSVAGNSVNVTSQNDTVLSGNNKAENIIINSAKETVISNASTEGNLTNNSESITVDGANLANITTNSQTANIDNMIVKNNANISTIDKTTIGNAKINGDLINTSKNTEVTGKLTVKGDANIVSKDSITIADAEISKNLNVDAPNITIKDMDLYGNIYAKTDNIDAKTSSDFNIGNISGKNQAYTENVKLSSDKSIYNGRTDNGTNIYAKDIDLKANGAISTDEKPLNIMLANGNKMSMASNDFIAISTNGSNANYSKLETDTLALYTDEDINIDYVNVNNLRIKTTSQNLSIDKMIVNKKATLDTANKHIVIDNTSLKPIMDADIQMYLSKLPAKLVVDGSDNIITDAVNVTRQNENISINMDKKYSSMDSSVTSSSAAALKMTNVSEKTIDKIDSLIYKIPTQTTYKNYIQPSMQSVIMTQIDELVTPGNAFDVINVSNKQNVKSSSDIL